MTATAAGAPGTTAAAGADARCLAAALALAAHGLRVLLLHAVHDGLCTCGDPSCKHPGKHPRFTGGWKTATTDEATIRRWFAQYPDSNIGIATGAVNGLVILDIDPRHGGDESLRRLCTEYGLTLDTPAVRTGGDGAHYYFKHPGGSITSRVGLYLGIDIRADGGYVVAPPSLHKSGKRYAWEPGSGLDDVALAPVPGWLLEKFIEPPRPPRQAGDATGPIREGARNDSMFRRGCSMRAHGFAAEAILAALMAENAGRCAPPLGADEVAQIAASVARYEPGAARRGDAGRAAQLSFHTADEIASLPGAKVRWIVPPWVAAGSITEITGKAKTAGKTTFVLSAVASILRGEPFLGQATQRVRVVYLSEERPATFRVALKRAGLLGAKDLHVLFWGNAVGVPWSEVVARAAQQQDGPGVLVVDTVGQFSGMTGDQENSSAAALEVLAPLQEVAAQGHAVIVVRHERKGGGAVGEAGRGSSAYTGAADIVMSIRRPEGRAPLTRRVLHALSRFDETPETLVIERTADGFKSCGDETAAASADDEEAILDALAQETMDTTALEAATDLKRAAAQRALKRLLAAGRLTKTGTGHKGSPFLYSRQPLGGLVEPNRMTRGETARPRGREILLRTRIVVGPNRMTRAGSPFWPHSTTCTCRQNATARSPSGGSTGPEGKHDHPWPRERLLTTGSARQIPHNLHFCETTMEQQS